MVIITISILVTLFLTFKNLVDGTYHYPIRTAELLCNIAHLVLIIVTWKFPLMLCFVHAPLIVLLQIPTLLWYADPSQSDVPTAMLSTVSALFLTLLFGFITNACWLLTTFSLLASATTVLVFYYQTYGFINADCSTLIYMIICVMAFSLYKSELRYKSEMINFEEIKEMN